MRTRTARAHTHTYTHIRGIVIVKSWLVLWTTNPRRYCDRVIYRYRLFTGQKQIYIFKRAEHFFQDDIYNILYIIIIYDSARAIARGLG